MIIEDKVYAIDEVFALIGEENLMKDSGKTKKFTNIVVDGFDVYPSSLRYMTFYQKGLVCPCCGKVATHFKLCGDPETKRRHFNLYADDGTLFTKDHIIPKSKGGKDVVDNMQTMCEDCNKAKGDYHPDIKTTYIVATNSALNRQLLFRTIKKAAFHIIQVHLKPSKKNHDNTIHQSIGAVLGIQEALASGESYCGYVWTTEER